MPTLPLPRIRQLVIAATELEEAADTLCHVLGTQVAFRDDLSAFGLANVLLPLGDSFVEIVSPIVSPPEKTAGGRHIARCGGDCGYMVIAQIEDFATAKKRFDQHGLRTVWDIDRDNRGSYAKAAHLHPADVPGAILSLDEMTPEAEWQWAGADWRDYPSSDPAALLTGCGFASVDPVGLAEAWGRAVGEAPALKDGAAEIILGETRIDFAPREHYGMDSDCVPHRLAAFYLRSSDVQGVVQRAGQRGLPTGEDHFVAYGVRFELTAI